jgi:dolichyl-phosphate-mannose-protein mannosyltransferase
MKNLKMRDSIIVISLSIIFFLMASLNLGYKEIPSSGWTVSGDDDVYIFLEEETNVSEILLFQKNGQLNFEVLTGQPEYWINEKTISIHDYYRWIRIEINQSTSIVKIDFENSYGELLEIVVIEEGHRIDTFSLYNEKDENNSIWRLNDEQEKVVLPITYLSETVFDEIYYVQAAEQYLSRIDPFEVTHPPLGKLIIATGVSIFGFNPYGWRIMGVLFATLMLPIIYFLGKEISNSWLGGFISSLLLMFDFMHFTLSRIALLDTSLVLFLLCSQLFFFRYVLDYLKNGWSASLRPYFLSVFFLAIGFSIKWSALFSFAGQSFFLYMLKFDFTQKNTKIDYGYNSNKKKIIYLVSGTILIFGIVYLISYVPYLRLGHSLWDIYNRQWSMINSHMILTETHPFSSRWWTWPLILKPVWLYLSKLGEESVSTITLMGNPAVWWIGIISVIAVSTKAIKEKKTSHIYLVTMFIFQWIPYVFLSRTQYIFYFYPNVLILCLITSTHISKLWEEKKERRKVFIYILLVVGFFGLFYPIISGNRISIWWKEMLKWLPDWVF